MKYDFTRNSVYITGTTFASNTLPETSSDFQRSTCFLGELPIASIESWRSDDPPKPPLANADFQIPDSLDDRETMGCNMIYHNDDPASTSADVLFVGGVVDKDSTKRNGIIEAFANAYQRNRVQPNWKSSSTPKEFQNPTNEITNPVASSVWWPIAMTRGTDDSYSKNDVFSVVLVGSDDGLLTEEYVESGDANNKKNFKNSLLPPGFHGGDPGKYAIHKRGSGYFMSLQHYYYTEAGALEYINGEDIKARGKEGSEVFPTGMINLLPNRRRILVAGYLKGRGPGVFTIGTFDKKDDDGNFLVDDHDGFAAIKVLSSGRPNGVWDKNGTIKFSSIERSPALDDYVHAICSSPFDSEGNTDAYYVVGSTYGTMPAGSEQDQITTNILSGNTDANTDGNKISRISSWVSKVSATKDVATVLWTTQLYATKDNLTFEGGKTEAIGCHVLDQDKTKMYVGGNVYNGGVMDSSENNAGGDDVWIAQLNTGDGSLRWIRQIGSSGDERLARVNSIESDLNGNAIIYGETTGELYRTRKSGEPLKTDDGTSTDIFIATLDLTTGSSESTIESDRNSSGNSGVVVGSIVAVVLVLLCLGGGIVMKWRRAKRYATRDADGIITDKPSFKDEDDSNGSSDGDGPVVHGESPPSDAFVIS